MSYIWEGGYARALEGAYFARALAEAREQRRICRLAADPLLPVRAFFDIGGSGASADAMAIWIAQFVDREIRVLDYIEGSGQVLAHYVGLLRARGWAGALCVLPHDGVAENSITGKRYEDRLSCSGNDNSGRFQRWIDERANCPLGRFGADRVALSNAPARAGDQSLTV